MLRITKLNSPEEWWGQFPILVDVPKPTRCRCNKGMIVVGSMKGGFIKGNCKDCASYSTMRAIDDVTFLSLEIEVQCPFCNQAMAKVAGGSAENPTPLNHVLDCRTCRCYVWLFDLVPFYEDLQLANKQKQLDRFHKSDFYRKTYRTATQPTQSRSGD
jgi:ribosomal protein S27E